jgi:hypothetical protein
LVAQVKITRELPINSPTFKLSKSDSKWHKNQLNSSCASLLSYALLSSSSNVVPVLECLENIGFQVEKGIFTPSKMKEHVLVVSQGWPL